MGTRRFRKVRVNNATFHSRLGRHTGGRECMQSFGFARLVLAPYNPHKTALGLVDSRAWEFRSCHQLMSDDERKPGCVGEVDIV
jgi:hypothetical protein